MICLQLLKWDDEESPDPEAVKEKYEIKEIQGDVDHCGGKRLFDMAERETLLKEIEGLRSQLQSHNGASTNKSMERTRSSLLAQSMQLRKSGAYLKSSGEELEKERERWTEMESEWICLTDELRSDLETWIMTSKDHSLGKLKRSSIMRNYRRSTRGSNEQSGGFKILG